MAGLGLTGQHDGACFYLLAQSALILVGPEHPQPPPVSRTGCTSALPSHCPGGETVTAVFKQLVIHLNGFKELLHKYEKGRMLNISCVNTGNLQGCF